MTEKVQLLRIAQVTQVTSQVRCFRLVSAVTGQNLAMFRPGQYLNLFFEIEGTTTSRPYSIASSPSDAAAGFYELFVHCGGSFTAPWLFAHGHVGTTVCSSLPEGEFCYLPERDTRHVIGISGGMSVTPLRSMARAVVDGSLKIDLTLFCGWDFASDMLFYKEFSDYAAQCPRFHVVFAISEECLPGTELGYITLELLRRHTNPEGATFFLCGPAAMYSALAQALLPLNIPPQNYHQELPGEIKSPLGCAGYPGDVPPELTLRVRLGDREHTLPMLSHETVLVAMERAGLAPPARCRSGQCGFCLSRLVGGAVFVPLERDVRTEAQRKAGLIHPCSSFPLSDLSLIVDCKQKRAGREA